MTKVHYSTVTIEVPKFLAFILHAAKAKYSYLQRPLWVKDWTGCTNYTNNAIIRAEIWIIFIVGEPQSRQTVKRSIILNREVSTDED